MSEKNPTLRSIFVSYRREDSAAYAGRICDHLEALFGEDRIFMDVEDIRPGQPQPVRLQSPARLRTKELDPLRQPPGWPEGGRYSVYP